MCTAYNATLLYRGERLKRKWARVRCAQLAATHPLSPLSSASLTARTSATKRCSWCWYVLSPLPYTRHTVVRPLLMPSQGSSDGGLSPPAGAPAALLVVVVVAAVNTTRLPNTGMMKLSTDRVPLATCRAAGG